MSYLFLILVWHLYALLEGVREAYYYSVKTASNKLKEFNEHPMFTLQRGFFLTIVVLCPGFNLLYSLLFGLSLCFGFPFMHDGAYYEVRKRLDKIYSKGWFDQSTGSSALSNNFLTPVVRTIMMIISIIGVVLLYLKFSR